LNPLAVTAERHAKQIGILRCGTFAPQGADTQDYPR
jgi:hypothetical protein